MILILSKIMPIDKKKGISQDPQNPSSSFFAKTFSDRDRCEKTTAPHTLQGRGLVAKARPPTGGSPLF